MTACRLFAVLLVGASVSFSNAYVGSLEYKKAVIDAIDADGSIPSCDIDQLKSPLHYLEQDECYQALGSSLPPLKGYTCPQPCVELIRITGESCLNEYDDGYTAVLERITDQLVDGELPANDTDLQLILVEYNSGQLFVGGETINSTDAFRTYMDFDVDEKNALIRSLVQLYVSDVLDMRQGIGLVDFCDRIPIQTKIIRKHMFQIDPK